MMPAQSTLRRSTDVMLPLMLGILIGALGTFSVFSGRLSTLEAQQQSLVYDLRDTKAEVRAIGVIARSVPAPAFLPPPMVR